jgi:hypothetical protein
MASPDPLVRKKSPRAPSISLDEALDKALKVYEKERLNAAPSDVVAQGMGYKDANNGRALGAIASVRYYGLMERRSDGRLAVTKEVENYKYAPSEDMRRAYLRRFVTAPAVFAELFEKYSSGLPSDGNLRYELIQRDFLPATAESLVGVLRRSAEFAKLYEQEEDDSVKPTAFHVEGEEPDHSVEMLTGNPVPAASSTSLIASSATFAQQQGPGHTPREDELVDEHDRIPVRLSGGRRAWLLIPSIFREADKLRLKAQIDLLLTEDGEE